MAITDKAEISAPPRGSARQHILDCAKRLFAVRGFDGVSISDIAEDSGASKANIFHHFESKEKLYLAVIASVAERSPPYPAPARPDRSVVEFFQDMAVAEMREAGKDELGVRLILQEVSSGNPQRSRVLAEDVFAVDFTRLVELIRAQQGEGHFRPDIDPALAAIVLRSATAFYLLSRDVLRHLPGVKFADDPEHYAREAAGLILRGLVANSGNEEK